MWHSVSTLEIVFKSLISLEPWQSDPYCLPIPWRSEREFNLVKKSYKPSFGFMPNDGLVTPHPPVARALSIVQKALENQGYQLVEWAPPSNNESIEIHVGCIMNMESNRNIDQFFRQCPIARGDGCPDAYEAIRLSGEPIVPEVAHLFPHGKPKPPITLQEYEKVVMHRTDFRAKGRTTGSRRRRGLTLVYITDRFWMTAADVSDRQTSRSCHFSREPVCCRAAGKILSLSYVEAVRLLFGTLIYDKNF
ncbi:hypothetical protein J3458_020668 [Metarhizium acridum]|uniref:uncharacterized protein n=1 Tax=Metarhizium acridum TaxID=92637 RepID=UPI001C6C6824|nr:hypothetical protein J3458_020668 [Metarhizium acridum]